MIEGLLNLHVQGIEVHHVLLDLVDRQLNQHTGDLRSLVVTNNLLDVLVDDTTDLLLHVRVVGIQGWNVFGCRLNVSLLDCHLVWIHSHLVWRHWHTRSIRLLLLLLLMHLWLWLLLLLMLLSHSVLVSHTLVHLLLATHTWMHLLLAHSLITAMGILSHTSLVVAALVHLSWTSVMLESSS